MQKKCATITTLILSLLLTLITSGCGKSAQTFNNLTDYDQQQGHLGWSYLFGNVNFQPSFMTYDAYTGCYNSTDAAVMGEEWKPHQNEDIILRFESPQSGEASVHYMVNLVQVQRADDDGVLFSIYNKNTSTALTETSLTGNGDESAIEGELSIQVKKGDPIYFVLNAGYVSDNDLTNVNVTVSFE